MAQDKNGKVNTVVVLNWLAARVRSLEKRLVELERYDSENHPPAQHHEREISEIQEQEQLAVLGKEEKDVRQAPGFQEQEITREVTRPECKLQGLPKQEAELDLDTKTKELLGLREDFKLELERRMDEKVEVLNLQVVQAIRESFKDLLKREDLQSLADHGMALSKKVSAFQVGLKQGLEEKVKELYPVLTEALRESMKDLMKKEDLQALEEKGLDLVKRVAVVESELKAAKGREGPRPGEGVRRPIDRCLREIDELKFCRDRMEVALEDLGHPGFTYGYDVTLSEEEEMEEEMVQSRATGAP